MKMKMNRFFIPCETDSSICLHGKKNRGHIIELPKVISYTIGGTHRHTCQVCGEEIELKISIETVKKIEGNHRPLV